MDYIEKNEQSEQVYPTWEWEDGLKRPWFPVVDKLPEFVETVRTHQVTILDAETGAGKTRYLGQAILQEFPDHEIFMTQTRRNAVRWNGTRIANDLREEPGGTVGWTLRGDDPVESRDTRLHLMIDQSLVNKIRRDGSLPEGVIIVDEAHERSISTDLLLGLIKQYLPNSPKTKVVITSATIDTEKFKTYFVGSESLHVKGRNYPVRVEPVRLSKYEHHTQGAIRAGTDVMEKFVKGELTRPANAEGEPDIPIYEGAVVVLLPGKDDISSTIKSLEREIERNKYDPTKFEIVQCHGEMTKQEQDVVMKPVKSGVLRFVVATEVVRSSVTPANVVGVIDSLQIKRKITNEKGVAHLDKIAVSWAEAKQAEGRAGRTQSGFSIPISFEREYENLSRWPQPAILREPIASVVLQVADTGLDARTFPFIDPPKKEMVDVAIKRLQKIEALDENEKITDIGELLVRFPIDPERAKSLLIADELQVLPEVMIATAVIENEGFFFRPREDARPILAVSEAIVRKILADKTYIELKDVDLSKLPSWVKRGRDGMFLIDTKEADFSRPETEIEKISKLIWKEYAKDTGSDIVAAIHGYRDYIAAKQRMKQLVSEHNKQISGKKNAGQPWSVDYMLREWCAQHCFNLKRLQFIDHTLDMLKDEIQTTSLQVNGSVEQVRAFDHAAVVKSMIAGMVDNILKKDGYYYKGPLGSGIEIHYGSVAQSASPEILFVSGVRKQVTRRGKELFIADMVSPVELSWIEEMMSQRIKTDWADGSIALERYTQSGRIVGTKRWHLDDLMIHEEQMDPPDELVARFISNHVESTYSDLKHPDAEYNEQRLKYLKSLQWRMLPQSGTKVDVISWYRMKLLGCRTFEDARKINLKLTDEVIGTLMGENYPEYVKRVNDAYPDQIFVAGEPCLVEYYRPSDSEPVRATVLLSILLMERITSKELPHFTDAVMHVGVRQNTSTYASGKLDEWQDVHDRSERQRLQEVWSRFESQVIRERKDPEWFSDKGEPLPQLPSDELIWDGLRSQKTYPAWVRQWSGSTEYKVGWFKSKIDADEAMLKFDEQINFQKRTEEVKAEFERISIRIHEIQEAGQMRTFGFNDTELGRGLYGDSLEYKLKRTGQLAGTGGYQPQPLEAKRELEALAARLAEAEKYKELNDSVAAQITINVESVRETIRKISERFGERNDVSEVTKVLDAETTIGHAIGTQAVINDHKELLQFYIARIEKEQAGEIVIEPVIQIHNSGNGRMVENAWVITPQGGIVEPRESTDKQAIFDDISTDDLIISFEHSNYTYTYEERFTTHRLPKRITNEQVRTLEKLRNAQNKYFVGNLGGWDITKTGSVIIRTLYRSEFRDYLVMDDVDYESARINTGEWETQKDGDAIVLLPQKKSLTINVEGVDLPDTSMSAAWKEALEKKEKKKKG